MNRKLLTLLLVVSFVLPACGTPRRSGDDDDDSEPPVTIFDLLFVVDNSNSMDRIQSDLGEAFPGTISELAASELDFQVAVTTTDMMASGNGNQGDLRSSDPIGAPGCEGFEAVTAETGSLASLVDVGVNGSGDEQGIFAATVALCMAQTPSWWSDLETLPEDNPTRVLCSAVPTANRTCNSGFLREGSAVVVSIFSDEGDDTERLEVFPPFASLSNCVEDNPDFDEIDCRLQWWNEAMDGFGHSISFINFGPTYQFESDSNSICEGEEVTIPGPCNPFGSTTGSIDLMQKSTCRNHGGFFPIEEPTVVDDPTTCEPVDFEELSGAYSETINAISTGGTSSN